MATPKEEKEYESCSVVVSVRCRPFNEREKLLGAKHCIEFLPGGKSLRIYAGGVPTLQQEKPPGPQHAFTFDYVYPASVSQDQVFLDIGRPVLSASFAGFNACIFAYGQTGSGKSYAMMGPAGGRDATKNPGLIPRICTQMFEDIAAKVRENEAEVARAKEEGKAENEIPATLTIDVELTYLEIYQERVKCLLNPAKENLKVRQHPKLGVFVEGLTHLSVRSFDQVMDFIEGGNAVRHVTATNMNESSSRSHAIFALVLKQCRTLVTKMGEDVSERVSRVNLVDLAGSERAKSTGAEGDTLKEGSNINKSLTVLGQVISGLADLAKPQAKGAKATFIPYRDSTLTWLLKENLGGNSKTYMLSTLSPADVNYDETLSTLRYADRAKAIVTKACVNEDPRTKLIQDLQAELAEARRKMAMMEEHAKRMPPPFRAAAVPALPLQKVDGPRDRLSVAAAEETVRSPAFEEEAFGSTTNDWLTTPRTPIQLEVYKAQAELTEHYLADMTLSKTQREASEQQFMEERAEALTKLKKTVKAQSNDAYLMNIDGGGDWVIEYLVDDVTYLAGDPGSMTPVGDGARVIQVIAHDDILSPHCCIIRKGMGQFYLRALDNESTFVDDSDEPLRSDTLLSRGQTIQLGEYINLKFVDNSAPVQVSRKARMSVKQSVGMPKPVARQGSLSGLQGAGAPKPQAASPPGAATEEERSSSPPARVPMLALPMKKDHHTDPNRAPLLAKALQPAPGGATPPAATMSPSDSRSTSPAVTPEKQPPEIPKLKLMAQSRGSATPRPGVPQLNLAKTAQGGATPRGPSTARPALGMGPTSAKAVPVVRTPRSMAATHYAPSHAEEMQTVNKHTFVVLGDTNSGKTTLRHILEKESTSTFSFSLPFGAKRLPDVLPTLGFDSNVIRSGTMSKVDITFLEFSGLDPFATLQLMIPEQRVSFILCWRLVETIDLQSFRKYVEMIQCRSPTSDTTVILVATCRDLVKHYNDFQVQNILQDAQVQLTSFLSALEPNEARRPRIVHRFAVNNKDKVVVSTAAKVKRHADLVLWLADHATTRCKTDQDFPHSLVPTRVLQLERQVLEMRNRSWAISSAEYKTLARSVDLKYDRSIEELHKHTQLLQSWGVLYHAFRHMLMKKYVILDVKWVFRVVATLSCCINTHTGYIKSGEQNHVASPSFASAGQGWLPSVVGMTGSGGAASVQHPPFSGSIVAFGDRLPFSVQEIARRDTHGMLSHGVLTLMVAEEMFGLLMREKGLTDRRSDVHKIVELLQRFDLVMEGSKIFCRALNNNSIHSELLAASHSSADSIHEEEALAHLAVEEGDEASAFYLIPSCFNYPVPSTIPIHMARLLYGPSLRFALNTVPAFFFARLVVRISTYAQKVYVGPVATQQGKASGAPEIVGATFWGNCLWVVSSDVSRALIRMVQRSVFVTFHDPLIDFEFREGVATAVQSLIAEFPGVRCEQSEQCCYCEQWIEPAPSEEYYAPIPREDASPENGEDGAEEDEGAEEELMFVAPVCPACGSPRFKSAREYLDTPFVADEALSALLKDDFVTDDTQARLQRCFKHIAKGRTMLAATLDTDGTRGARIEGAGLDSLLDTLGTA